MCYSLGTMSGTLYIFYNVLVIRKLRIKESKYTATITHCGVYVFVCFAYLSIYINVYIHI